MRVLVAGCSVAAGVFVVMTLLPILGWKWTVLLVLGVLWAMDALGDNLA